MDRNTLTHPYRSLQVPSAAAFKLQPSPGKGWGAFATSNINSGAPILSEKPLFVIRKTHGQITEGGIAAAFQHLMPRDKQQFLLLRDNATSSFKYMEEAFPENSFALRHINGHGLFLLHSRFNHSCIPNCKIPVSDGETIESYATRDISAGEEITFCYLSDFECRTRHERHRLLRFRCDCKAYLLGPDFQRLSDMRWTLIRGLQCLMLGVDIDGKRHALALAIIIDKRLKEAAETYNIPLSSRFIYCLFTVFLLEEEGLLDEIMVPQAKYIANIESIQDAKQRHNCYDCSGARNMAEEILYGSHTLWA